MHQVNSMRICVYSYSSMAWFFRGLIQACRAGGDDVEWSVVLPQGHFREVISNLVPVERCCYLYEDFNSRYRSIGPDDIEDALNSGEGLATALMKDKDGYRWLEKEEQLRRGAVMHKTYREFLERVRPDYVLFPDVETVDGFVLINVCQRLDIPILYHVGMRMLGCGFFSEDPYEALPPYLGNYTKQDIEAARSEIRRFVERQSRGPGSNYQPVSVPKTALWRRALTSESLRMGNERLHVSEDGIFLRIKSNIRPLLQRLRRLRFELGHARYFDASNSGPALPERFVFYALQYTPESSINGLEPYYFEQSRIIDALLLNLPQGYRLVVKEHPAMYGMRPGAFYRELRRRPGLVLVHPSVDTRGLIERAALTVTVTGTIGLECFLMGKPCVIFGRNFFRHLCYVPPALGELRAFLQKIISDHETPSEEKKEIEIAKLLNIGADFVISDPWFSPSVMSEENIATARAYLWRHLARLRSAQGGTPSKNPGQPGSE